MTDTTESRINRLLAEHLGVDLERVLPETYLVAPHDARGRAINTDQLNLGADSLDVVEITMALEEEFRLQITDDEAEPMNTGTVQTVYDLVNGKL